MSTPLPASGLAKPFEFSDKDFDTLRKIITAKVGIELPDRKKSLVYTRLVRRLRALKLDSFQSYIDLLNKQIQTGDDTELNNVINAITTNVTSFFREKHHFEIFEQKLPELHKHFGSLNIWCAAASTGEEPWSISMVLNEFKSKTPGCMTKFTATDIDTNALKQASEGVYNMAADQRSTHPLLVKHLKSFQGDVEKKPIANQQTFRITDDIRNLVNYRQVNLMENWDLPFAKIHVVFMRNVIIYFSKETQRKIFSKLAELMPSGSILFIGHSESLFNVSDDYEGIGRTAYVRK